MTGAYVSYDGGRNWRMFNLWTVPADFAFDPSNPNTVYAANRGYRHSEVRGKRWRIIYPDVSKVKKAERLQNSDLLPSDLIEGALDGSIDKIMVDPANSRRIYLGLSPLVSYIGSSGKKDDSNAAMLVLSTNYGESWKRIEGYRFKWGQRAIPDIHNSGMLYLTTYGGSIYYGPAAGVPNAFEDIENMPEGWW